MIPKQIPVQIPERHQSIMSLPILQKEWAGQRKIIKVNLLQIQRKIHKLMSRRMIPAVKHLNQLSMTKYRTFIFLTAKIF